MKDPIPFDAYSAFMRGLSALTQDHPEFRDSLNEYRLSVVKDACARERPGPPHIAIVYSVAIPDVGSFEFHSLELAESFQRDEGGEISQSETPRALRGAYREWKGPRQWMDINSDGVYDRLPTR